LAYFVYALKLAKLIIFKLFNEKTQQKGLLIVLIN